MYATVMSQITRPRVLLADRLLQGKILFDLEKYEEAKAVFEHIIEHDYTQEYKDQKEYYSDYTHTIDPAINEAAEYLSRITAIQTPQSPRVFSPSSS
ncbi:MAG: hypothetical protein WCG98_07450 [bacterium]